LTTPSELTELIKQLEGPMLDFKRSDILSHSNELAKLMVAFTNTMGGKILIGIDDERNIEGMSAKKEHEEFIMNIARDKSDPPISPRFEIVKIDGSDVYIVTIPRFKYLPHGLKTLSGKVYYIRVGSTVREASPQELQILFSGATPYLQDLKNLLKKEISNNLSLAHQTSKMLSELLDLRPTLSYQFFRRDVWDSILARGELNLFGNDEIADLCRRCYGKIDEVNQLIRLQMEKGGKFILTLGANTSIGINAKIREEVVKLYGLLSELNRRLETIA